MENLALVLVGATGLLVGFLAGFATRAQLSLRHRRNLAWGPGSIPARPERTARPEAASAGK